MAKNNFKHFDNRIKNKNKGFTLVELIVVLTVMSILLGITVFSLIAWQDNARFNKQNEYAQTLFNAAQSQLAEYASNQALEEFDASVKNGAGVYTRTVDITAIKDSDGRYYDLTNVWYQSAGVPDSEKAKYQGTICYAMCYAGDYDKYIAGTLDSNTGAEVVFKLLQSSLYDVSLLNNSICIEFAPIDGQVFSVLFSDRKEGFTYGNTNGEVVSINDRTMPVLREYMTGYYGVDTLAKATAGNTSNLRPNLADVKLINEDTLNLSFRISNYKELLTQLSYEITVFDADTGDKRLLLTLHTSEAKINNYAYRGEIPVEVVRYSKDSDGKDITTVLGSYKMLCWVAPDKAGNSNLHLALDAADVQADSVLYKNDLQLGLMTGLGNGVRTDDTYSFHRFGIDADNIYCTISTMAGRYRASKVKTSNTESAYYASTALAQTNNSGIISYTYTKKLSNGRHLYNVRFDEDLSWSERAQYSSKISSLVSENYILTDNIDWNAFVARGGLYYSSGAKSFVDNNGDPVVVGNDANGNPITITYAQLVNPGMNSLGYARVMTSCPFPSIRQLRATDSFAGGNIDISFMKDGNYTQEQKEVKASKLTISGVKKIENITITEIANQFLGVYEETGNIIGKSSTVMPVGLIAENHGSIHSLVMDKVTVYGDEMVGGFAGINRGDMHCLEMSSSDYSSNIIGRENIGGIMGYIMPDVSASQRKVDYCFLTNRAAVSGTTYVGGIVGQTKLTETSSLESIKIEYCANYGAMKAVGANQKEPKYIGGIAGYSRNEQAAVDISKLDRITFENCMSSPQYSSTDIAAILDTVNLEDGNAIVVATLGGQLKGIYVGGIVGYNYFGTLKNCSTDADNGRTGYIFGYQYVGGIVGFNQGPASGIDGASTNSAFVKRSTNAANVVGAKYVGGITGCNANVDFEATATAADGIVVPDNNRSTEIKISNWTNKGIVFATDSYAGGITGYNAGWIFNCSSEVGDTGVYDFFQKTYSGDYAGGIAGYNNGYIGNSELTPNDAGVIVSHGKISAICYISGKNYVGGIVGYNDVDAVVEDYELAGGYIRGLGNDSCFVGGYAGFNASVNLLMDRNGEAHNIVANPNEVSGQYFVGGSIGGNVIALAGNENISSNFMTNNLLGEMSGDAFVGGFIGYNLLIKRNIGENGAPIVNELQADLVNKIKLAEKNNADDEAAKLAIIDRIVRSVTGSVIGNEQYADGSRVLMNKMYVKAGGRLIIVGGGMNQAGSIDNTSDYSINSLGIISGKLYVAGVLGYCDEKTELLIQNVRNTTPVEATAAISVAGQRKAAAEVDSDNAEIDYTGINKTVFMYSYSGGITGRVSKHTVIDNCQNTSSATIKTKGTYTGGLCEVNEGTIKNCEVYSFGSSVTDYIGGLCGLNKGSVINSRINNRSISGAKIVGGLVAENFGTIDGININGLNLSVAGGSVEVANAATNSGYVIEKHAVAAAIAAYNAPSGMIIISSPDGYSDINSSNTADSFNGISIFTRGDYVGTVAGINEGSIHNESAEAATDEARFVRLSGTVSGNKAVGGLIGWNKPVNTSQTISYIYNTSVITASNGYAGGIVGANVAGINIDSGETIGIEITHCVNSGVVTASNSGNAGGITSVNSGVITYCTDYKSVFAPKGMTGGICAVNVGEITECKVQPENYSAQQWTGDSEILSFSSIKMVGGIAADNFGTINNCRVYGTQVKNYSTSETGFIGIITGINEPEGRIVFTNEKDAAGIYKREIFVNDSEALTYTNHSSAGGVAGFNYGKIIGTLSNNSADYGYNEIPVTVIACKVGFVDGLASVASLGGVAGRNTGEIEKISVIGNIEEHVSLGNENNGYGGIVGFSGYSQELKNNGETIYPAKISQCTFDGTVWAGGSGTSMVRIGGIVGLNSYSSKIERCLVGVYSDADLACDSNETRIYAGAVDGIDEVSTEITYMEGSNKINSGRYYITKAADPNSNSYVGGFVGENYGAILSGDNARLSKDSVRIEQFAGLIGGIVGVLEEGGSITGTEDYILSTGQNWHVCKRAAENDEALGGIVGGAYTVFEIEYADNYAETISCHKANNKVGGIVGVLMKSDAASPLVIDHCNNYGFLMSNSSAGGIGGEIFFAPMVVTNCNNYGTVVDIQASDNREAGGIIGRGDNILGEITIENCNNYGFICLKRGYGGGILGRHNINNSYTVHGNSIITITNCVNAGIIYNEAGFTTSGAIIGMLGSSGNGVIIQNCRNYGGGINASTESKSNVSLLGKSEGSASNIYISDCLTDSNNTIYTYKNSNNLIEEEERLQYAFVYDQGTAQRTTFTNNYFVNSYSLQDDDTFDAADVIAPDYGTYFRVVGSTYLGEKVDGTANAYVDGTINDLLGSPTEGRVWYSDKNTVMFHFDVSYADSAQGMDSFVFYPSNNNVDDTVYFYKYDVTFTDADGNFATVSGVTPAGKKRNAIIVPVPSGVSPLVKTIDCNVIHVTNGSNMTPTGKSYFKGFAWRPAGATQIIPMKSDLSYRKSLAPAYFNIEMSAVKKDGVTQATTSVKNWITTNDGTVGAWLYNYGSALAVPANMKSFYFEDLYNTSIWSTARLYIKMANSNSDREKLHFDIEYSDDITNLSEFVLYLTDSAGDASKATSNYMYIAVFTDENGEEAKYTLPTYINRPVGGTPSLECRIPVENATTALGEKLTGRIKAVDIYLWCTNSSEIYLKGFGWVPSVGTEGKVIPCAYNCTEVLGDPNDGSGNSSSGLGVYEGDATSAVAHGSGNKRLLVTYDTAAGKYYLYPSLATSFDETIGFYMLSKYNNPAASSFYSDLKSCSASKLSGNSYRYKVYEELDAQFENIFLPRTYSYYEDGERLATPNLTYSIKNGVYSVNWGAVNNAYRYSVYYVVKDSNGNEIESTRNNPAILLNSTLSYNLEAKNSWYSENGNTISFYVTALHAYHFSSESQDAAEYAKFDSATAELTKRTNRVLPAPDVVYEITALNNTNNKGNVAVLVNREDYRDADGNYIDCEIVVGFGSQNITSRIYPAISGHCVVMVGGSSKDANSFAYAQEIGYKMGNEPVKYMPSTVSFHAGSLLHNADLTNDVEDLAQNPSFKGFYGDTADALSYKIEYRLIYSSDGRDNYTMSDLVAYDDELMVDVAYASGVTHTANRVPGSVDLYITSELAGLPKDIVGKEITVRSYLYETQQHYVRNGHYVAQGIDKDTLCKYLNGELKDHNYFDTTVKVSYKTLYETVGEKYFKILYPSGKTTNTAIIADCIIAGDNTICDMVTDDDGNVIRYNIKNGYVIFDKQDGTYDIYYNASIERTYNEGTTRLARMVTYTPDDSNEIQYNITASTSNNAANPSIDVKIDGVSTVTQFMQNKPVINPEHIDSVNAEGKRCFTFSWDTDSAGGALYSDSKYAVELFGYSIENGEWVSISTINRQSENSAVFTDEQRNWNYTRFKLEVSRIGTTVSGSSSDQSVILPNSAEKEFIIKQKLDTISMPTIALTKVDGHFNKETLEYEVSWAAISALETEQLEDIAGYMIKTELENPEIDENGAENYKVQYFYVCSLSEGWDGETLYQGLPGSWNLALISANGASDVTETAVFANSEYQTIIDLSGYNSFDVVKVTVQAIAKNGALFYIDGDQSSANAITIPRRLTTPSGDMVSSTTEYNYDEAISEEELNQVGINVSINNDNYATTDSGTYKLAAAVFAQLPVNIDDKQAGKVGDSQVTGDGCWNDGALVTLATKSSPLTMNGTNLLTAMLNLKYSDRLSEYAGMWVKVVIKANSNNAISSYWSDEDADGDTLNYCWIRIPRVQIKDIDITYSVETQYLEELQVVPTIVDVPVADTNESAEGGEGSEGSEGTEGGEGSGSGEGSEDGEGGSTGNGNGAQVERTSTYTYEWSHISSEIAVDNRIISFAPVKFADGYTVALTGVNGDECRLYLEPVTNPAGEVIAIDAYEDTTLDGEYDSYLGNIARGGSMDNGSIVLSYEAVALLGNISIEDTENNKEAIEEINLGETTFHSAIWLDADGNVVILLPDVVRMTNENDDEISFAFTSEITVEQVVTADERHHLDGYKPGHGIRITSENIISGGETEKPEATNPAIIITAEKPEQTGSGSDGNGSGDASGGDTEAVKKAYATTVYVKKEIVTGEEND